VSKPASTKPTLDDFLKRSRTHRVNFLLVGRTGVGKSSTINSLLGRELLPVGDFEPTTMAVEKHDATVEGVPICVIDTPGLCDDLEAKGNDAAYLELIRRDAKEVHCVWFVTRLDETRVRSDEKRAIQVLTEGLGVKIWDHAMIVFTFADAVPEDRYEAYLNKRTELIRSAVAASIGPQKAARIPSVGVTNKGLMTPDGRYWSGHLLATVASVLPSDRVVTIIQAVKDRLVTEEDAKAGKAKEDSIIVDRDSGISLGRAVKQALESAKVGGEKGEEIGRIFGPEGEKVGRAVGTVVGGVVGFISGLFDW